MVAVDQTAAVCLLLNEEWKEVTMQRKGDSVEFLKTHIKFSCADIVTVYLSEENKTLAALKLSESCELALELSHVVVSADRVITLF